MITSDIPYKTYIVMGEIYCHCLRPITISARTPLEAEIIFLEYYNTEGINILSITESK